MSAHLSVPAPQLVLDPPAGPPAIEKPITVNLGLVRYPDSVPLGPDDTRVVGLFVFRGEPGSEQVWDEDAKVWKSVPIDAGSLASLTPIPLMPAKPDAPQPWTGTLVAAGQKDASGSDRFTAAVSGTPRYRVRPFAKGVRGGQTYTGLGAASSDLLFTSAAENQRFAVELDPEDPASATRVRLTLKNASLTPAGFIEITTVGGQTLDIANCTASGSVLARIRLTDAGDIRFEPGPGRRIILDGPLDAGEITFLPGGTGVRTTL